MLTFSEATLAIAVKLDLTPEGQLARPLSEQDNSGGIFHPEDAVACYDRCHKLEGGPALASSRGKAVMEAGSLDAKLG